MAEITIANNAEAIRFCNEVLRPLCEEARALKARSNALRIAWYAGMNTVFETASDTVVDGRESEGVSQLTAGDVTNAVAQLIKIATDEASEWNDQVIQLPCVRQIPSVS